MTDPNSDLTFTVILRGTGKDSMRVTVTSITTDDVDVVAVLNYKGELIESQVVDFVRVTAAQILAKTAKDMVTDLALKHGVVDPDQ